MTRPPARTAEMGVLSKSALAIDLIARTNEPVRLADVASALDMPKSTAHRMLNDLVDLDVLRRDENGRFLLGVRLLAWGAAADVSYNLRGVAASHMEALSQLSGESVNLHVVQGDHRVCIAVHRGAKTWFTPISVGQAHPLGLGAAGKMLLAFSPDDRFRTAVQQLEQIGATVPTEEQLSRIRASYWATTYDEVEVGLAAGATVVTGPGGRVIASLTIGGNSDRLQPERMEELRPEVMRAARAISDQLTGQA